MGIQLDMLVKKEKICIIKTDKYYYPNEDSFRSDTAYPEYPYKEYLAHDNHVYSMIREGFHMMGYDAENYGTSNWNPLKGFIKKGDCVVLKPNMVMDRNPSGGGVECLYTHPSIVAAILDYVIIALFGQGEIIVGDAPMQGCDFVKLVDQSGYDNMFCFYRKNLPKGIRISLKDFRQVKSYDDRAGVSHYNMSEVESVVVDLKDESEFAGESDYFYQNMRITSYDPNILKQHHNANKHEYCVNSDILKADVFINLPKPKTHRKAGVTIALKNAVGINARKEYLPHHTNGSLAEGGDEYLEKSWLKKQRNIFEDRRNYHSQTSGKYRWAWMWRQAVKIPGFFLRLSKKDEYREGSWYGNDTISRTIVDLNKILFYADKQGVMKTEKQRKYLIVADMIISGEKEGPVMPSPKDVGIIAIGENPVCFDEAIATLMGAKLEWIKTLTHARSSKGMYSLVGRDQEAFIVSNESKWNEKKVMEIDEKLYFVPTTGWREAFENRKL